MTVSKKVLDDYDSTDCTDLCFVFSRRYEKPLRCNGSVYTVEEVVWHATAVAHYYRRCESEIFAED